MRSDCPIERFEDLQAEAATTARGRGVERLDLIVGTLCEGNRPLHGFGQTQFAVFVPFASGRLPRDPWFSSAKYNDRYLAREGIRFIDDADLRGTILALCPEVAQRNLDRVDEHGEPLVHNALEPTSSTWQSAPEEHPLRSTGASGIERPARCRASRGVLRATCLREAGQPRRIRSIRFPLASSSTSLSR